MSFKSQGGKSIQPSCTRQLSESREIKSWFRVYTNNVFSKTAQEYTNSIVKNSKEETNSVLP